MPVATTSSIAMSPNMELQTRAMSTLPKPSMQRLKMETVAGWSAAILFPKAPSSTFL
jgi:hypothetical protein